MNFTSGSKGATRGQSMRLVGMMVRSRMKRREARCDRYFLEKYLSIVMSDIGLGNSEMPPKTRP